MSRRKPVSQQAQAAYETDAALADQFDDLLEKARTAEQALRAAQARRAGLAELRDLAKQFDAALTAAMRAAYAAQRATIGPRGYDDRIYRRKAMATSAVKAWTQEAERLLTLRESHRLTGLVRLPTVPAA
ncbi:MAG: hypothetical protein J2P34_05870 [Actinobacteria bacterium]|nr:hypothetical protein [Actinomycetota bacterium]